MTRVNLNICCFIGNLNASKYRYILFHRKQKIIPPYRRVLYVGDEEISRMTSTKFIGLVLDEHLSWESHMACVSKKIGSMRGYYLQNTKFTNGKVDISNL